MSIRLPVAPSRKGADKHLLQFFSRTDTSHSFVNGELEHCQITKMFQKEKNYCTEIVKHESFFLICHKWKFKVNLLKMKKLQDIVNFYSQTALES